MSVTWEYFRACSHTAPDSCARCDGTARDERDPNYFRARPGDAEAGNPENHGRRPLWSFIYPNTDQGDVA